MSSEAKMIGTAGEYIAMADALEQLISCQLIHGEPFDLLLFVSGEFIKVQVKTEKEMSPRRAHSFRPVKGSGRKIKYGADEVDIFAFVELGLRRTAWVSIAETSLSRHTIQEELFQDYTLERALSTHFSISPISGILSNSSQSKVMLSSP
jgi:hypothetical protein